MRRQKYLLGALSGICAVVGLAALASTSPPSGELTTTNSAVTNQPSFQSVKKQLEILNDRPSADTTPMYFSAGDVKYKIPRNYIVRMFDWSQKHLKDDIVTMRVTYPGFEPYSETTKDCLTKPPLYWPKGCIPIEFWITVAKGPIEKTSRVLTDEDKFNNLRDVFHSQIPKPGPGGFEMYEIGTEEARTEIYRKKHGDQTIVISCVLVQHDETGKRIDDDDRKRYGLCDNTWSLLSNGTSISYRIWLNQIQDAEAIDTGLRKLLMSFTVKESKP